MQRILIIEDDPDIALSLRYALERDGSFEVGVCADGREGLERIRREPPDLVLLDLNLPGLDGTELCRALRRDPATARLPLIMLTARAQEHDRVAGLDLGADDYVTKPFSVREVLARVRALLRRTAETTSLPGVLTHGSLRLDPARRTVSVDDRAITLTRKEFDLLADLMRRAGLVVTREQLLERVWGYDQPGATRTVDVHVRQLRRKLGAELAETIETVVGVGYRFRNAAR